MSIQDSQCVPVDSVQHGVAPPGELASGSTPPGLLAFEGLLQGTPSTSMPIPCMECQVCPPGPRHLAASEGTVPLPADIEDGISARIGHTEEAE